MSTCETMAAGSIACHHLVGETLAMLHMAISFDGVPLLVSITIAVATESITAVQRTVIVVVGVVMMATAAL